MTERQIKSSTPLRVRRMLFSLLIFFFDIVNSFRRRNGGISFCSWYNTHFLSVDYYNTFIRENIVPDAHLCNHADKTRQNPQQYCAC